MELGRNEELEGHITVLLVSCGIILFWENNLKALKEKNVTPRKHNCKKNWKGSAKSMEPAMACEMLQSVLDQGEKVNY